MSIPKSCTVLVVGDGPAGSFSAAALAREGIDVVVLEADTFPRYHVGESTLPCLRHFLKIIGLYEGFNSHGFNRKNGGAFVLNHDHPEAYTDFLAAGGPDGYAWNLVRSEADDMLFRHAGSSGARIFDSTKVTAIEFVPVKSETGAQLNGNSNVGKPVSARWNRGDGSAGTITFEYLIDASGRNGLLSTRYLKNRSFNQNLKRMASWGYFKGAGVYGVGTQREGAPYFEALQDASGWCWFIPLHDGTHSVGIVLDQDKAIARKRETGSPTSKEFYLQSLELVPHIKQLLSSAELVTDIQSASDWSYSASTYALPYARIAGDAGCFIDPYFSTGIHLAAMGGLSAAATIAASLKGDCDETTAASWHTKKISESYTAIFLVVSTVMKQIRCQEKPVIRQNDEKGFYKAFDVFKPVIQGTTDANEAARPSNSEMTDFIQYCLVALLQISPEDLKGLSQTCDLNDSATVNVTKGIAEKLGLEETQVLDLLKSTRIFTEGMFNIDDFMLSPVNGMTVSMERGQLGLKTGAGLVC